MPLGKSTPTFPSSSGIATNANVKTPSLTFFVNVTPSTAAVAFTLLFATPSGTANEIPKLFSLPTVPDAVASIVTTVLSADIDDVRPIPLPTAELQ